MHVKGFCICRIEDGCLLFEQNRVELKENELGAARFASRFFQAAENKQIGENEENNIPESYEINRTMLRTFDDGFYFSLVDEMLISYTAFCECEFPLKLAQQLLNRAKRELKNMPNYNKQSVKSISTFTRSFIVPIIEQIDSDCTKFHQFNQVTLLLPVEQSPNKAEKQNDQLKKDTSNNNTNSDCCVINVETLQQQQQNERSNHKQSDSKNNNKKHEVQENNNNENHNNNNVDVANQQNNNTLIQIDEDDDNHYSSRSGEYKSLKVDVQKNDQLQKPVLQSINESNGRNNRSICQEQQNQQKEQIQQQEQTQLQIKVQESSPEKQINSEPQDNMNGDKCQDKFDSVSQNLYFQSVNSKQFDSNYPILCSSYPSNISNNTNNISNNNNTNNNNSINTSKREYSKLKSATGLKSITENQQDSHKKEIVNYCSSKEINVKDVNGSLNRERKNRSAAYSINCKEDLEDINLQIDANQKLFTEYTHPSNFSTADQKAASEIEAIRQQQMKEENGENKLSNQNAIKEMEEKQMNNLVAVRNLKIKIVAAIIVVSIVLSIAVPLMK